MCIKTIIKIKFTSFAFVLCILSLNLSAQDTRPSNKNSIKKYQLAIIVDDIGAKASDIKAFDLPKNVTFSILPHTNFSKKFSNLSAQQNREVMLHMPMESLKDVNLGPGPLLANMYPKDIHVALTNALETVPHAVGVNNHMGSKLTQMTLPMTAIMEVLASSNLFFIDSRTTRFTKAKSIAIEAGVSTASRHVFLDHVADKGFMERQFALAIKRSRNKGKAILIGHPYRVTLEFLATELTKLPKDIELITVSEYLQETNKFRINPQLVQQAKERQQKDLSYLANMPTAFTSYQEQYPKHQRSQTEEDSQSTQVAPDQ